MYTCACVVACVCVCVSLYVRVCVGVVLFVYISNTRYDRTHASVGGRPWTMTSGDKFALRNPYHLSLRLSGRDTYDRAGKPFDADIPPRLEPEACQQ